jgi:hypothetical protein
MWCCDDRSLSAVTDRKINDLQNATRNKYPPVREWMRKSKTAAFHDVPGMPLGNLDSIVPKGSSITQANG